MQTTSNIFLWALVPTSLAIAMIEGLTNSADMYQLATTAMLLVSQAFLIIHSLRRYSWRNMLALLLIVAFWALFWENLSLYTGFPFGNYHYADSLGPKLLRVPYLIILSYFFLVYLSWNMAHVLLRRYSNKISGQMVAVLPVIATFIVVMFDMVFDPFVSTVLGNYIWHEGGAFFGVPFENFMGWYICTYTMLQSFALYMWKKTQWMSIEADEPPVIFKRSFWLQNILIYFVWPAQYIIKGFTVDPTVMVSSLDGMMWKLSSLLQSAGLISLSTIWFITLLAIIQVTVLKEVSTRAGKMKPL